MHRPNTIERPGAATGPVTGPETEREIDRLDRLADRLDAAFRIPGTQIRLGWDSLLGLIPGVGDTLSVLPGAYIIYRAHALGARKRTLASMALNSGIDWVIGSVPLVGDLFDIGYRSNSRNVALLRQEMDLPPRLPEKA